MEIWRSNCRLEQEFQSPVRLRTGLFFKQTSLAYAVDMH